MIQKLNNFIVSCSHSWWKFLLLFAGQGGTISILNNISARFPNATSGYEPFDMQNRLSSDDIFTQLESYTPEAFQLYAWFQAVDYLFPLFAGLVLATAGAFALRHAWPAFYAGVVEKQLLWVLMLPTVFDWLENINLLWVITAWPDQAELAANLAIAAKIGKLTSMSVVFLIIGLLLLWATMRWTVSRLSNDPQQNQR